MTSNAETGRRANLVHERELAAAAVPGDTVVARVTVEDLDQAKARVRFSTICSVADKVVVEGVALAMVPRRQQSV